MKLGIMQPYLFPYIGYFQLINEVDKFIFYDDVTFIKQGWINRNQILINNQAKMFSVPLSNASSYTMIKDVLISDHRYEKWKKSFLSSIMFNYKKAENYETVRALIEDILSNPPETISELAIRSTIKVSNYLGIQTEFEISSDNYNNTQLSGQDRVIDICKAEQADIYINPLGGMKLYSKTTFEKKDIHLFFLSSSNNIVYKQFSEEFVPNLSIIDLLMFNDNISIKKILSQFTLIE